MKEYNQNTTKKELQSIIDRQTVELQEVDRLKQAIRSRDVQINNLKEQKKKDIADVIEKKDAEIGVKATHINEVTAKYKKEIEDLKKELEGTVPKEQFENLVMLYNQTVKNQNGLVGAFGDYLNLNTSARNLAGNALQNIQQDIAQTSQLAQKVFGKKQ